MPEGGAPGERARGIEEELRRLGYLEGRVDRFLERGGGGVGGCVTRALRVGGAGGPLLALLLLAFHATADPLLLTEPSRALLLLVLLVAGEILLVALLAIAINLHAFRAGAARIRGRAASGAALLVAAYGLLCWIHLRVTVAAGWKRLAADATVVLALVAITLLLYHFFSVAADAIAGAKGVERRRPWSLPLSLLPFSLALAVAAALAPERWDTSAPYRYDTRLTGKRVVWVILDGLSAPLFDRAAGAGWMPALARRARQASVLPLLLPEPAPPPQELWTTAVTGAPGKQHGIHHFARTRVRWRRAPQGARLAAALLPFLLPLETTPLSAAERRVPAIDEIVAGRGFRVVAVNGWCSGPVLEDGAARISDRALRLALVEAEAPSIAGECAPAAARRLAAPLLEELAAIPPRERAAQVDRLCLRLAVALEGALDGRPHLSLVTLSGTDLLLLGEPDEEGLASHLQALDRGLEELFGREPPGTAIIVSSAPGQGRPGDGRGFVLLAGEPFVEVTGESLEPVDLAPLVLRILGFPRAVDLPGRIPERLLEASFRERFPPWTIPSHGERMAARRAPLGDERQHLEALRTLGYMRQGGKR